MTRTQMKYDNKWHRDVGNGVPGYCDYPGCNEAILRDLAHVCGSTPFGGGVGCGLYFCGKHLELSEDDSVIELCERCTFNKVHTPDQAKPPFEPTADVPTWIDHKLSHSSWSHWRKKHPKEVLRMRERLEASQGLK